LENNNNRIAERVSLDEQKISFRDIISLLIEFIKRIYSSDENVKSSIRLDKLRKIGCTYPAQYLIFDFCLAALEGDLLDAKLFLGHAFNIIGLSNQLNLLLSAIVYTPLTSEKEVRELLTLLAWKFSLRIWRRTYKYMVKTFKKDIKSMKMK
jgi:hypothetical protein